MSHFVFSTIVPTQKFVVTALYERRKYDSHRLPLQFSCRVESADGEHKNLTRKYTELPLGWPFSGGRASRPPRRLTPTPRSREQEWPPSAFSFCAVERHKDLTQKYDAKVASGSLGPTGPRLEAASLPISPYVCGTPSVGISKRAFTLLEILVAVAVLAILLALFIVGYGHVRERIETAKCGNNMRSLHVSLSTYIQDKGHWPQEPETLWIAADQSAYEDWWIEILRPYGATDEVWMCPTIKRKVTAKSQNSRPKMHYTPTMFDEKPFTPYKWSTQPWLIEIGNMHGEGALICFPDGSIKTMNEVTGS